MAELPSLGRAIMAAAILLFPLIALLFTSGIQGGSVPWLFERVQSIPVTSQALKRDITPKYYGYAPSSVDCPSPQPTIRNSSTLSLEETNWLERRRNVTGWAIRDFLAKTNISGFDTNAYMDKVAGNATALPNIAIAISGGGWRAHMNGAGGVAAFDNRTTNSTSPGHLGGLLQAATYLAGLSGGAWLVGSLYVPQLRSVQELYTMDTNASTSLWQFDNTIIEGPATLSATQYYDEITDEVQNKENANFNTTITDLWGRGLSFQLFSATDGGPNYTFSGVAKNSDFQSALAPLPIIVAIERAPNQLLILANSSIYEINPWEIGTFDPPTLAFAPLQYIGSNFSNGTISGQNRCVTGFDNAGFVVGTSSSLFNQAFLQINKTDAPPRVLDYVSGKLQEIGIENNDISDWVNPFYQYRPEDNTNANSQILPLVDGGEDLQNIPLHPLLQPPRNVDVIFAVDSSADTSSPGANWPNGTAMVATYQRSLLSSGYEAPFPAVPDQNTFVNLGLNSRPTFFGCDANNLSQPTPLIVYIPNSPYSYQSNISTFQMETNDTERNAIIQNGYNVATRANGTVDTEWPACVGCAVLARSFWKTGTDVPTLCQQCFQRYCWNGTVNNTTPAPYVPAQVIKTSGGVLQVVVTRTALVITTLAALSLII